MNRAVKLIDRLENCGRLSGEEYAALLSVLDGENSGYLFEKASAVRERNFGNRIYIRGLIEISNICKNDCYYCGIRKSNDKVSRYRLSKEQILSCCEQGHELGFRTFVMQGGEDGFYTDERMTDIIISIKRKFPDCAVTLSLGERSKESYQRLFDAGADRYLLRHETADDAHYAKLHPKELSPLRRKQCLRELKEIGFQTGCGFMVGSPYQTVETLAQDLLFIQELKPQMVGIGPFIPQRDTPFAGEPAGSLKLTLYLLAVIRLMMPRVLLPATTALGTISPQGRELGILAGANVVMPNLSPAEVRGKYLLYDNKICTGTEAAEGLEDLKQRLAKIGCEVAVSRGDFSEQESP